MKTMTSTRLTLALLCLFLTNGSYAAARAWQIGVVGGIMTTDITGLDNAVNAGAALSYDFGRFALEGIYTASVTDGDASIGPLSGDWDVTTIAAYGVYHSLGRYYLKAKAGYLNEDVTIRVGSISSGNEDNGASFGIGGGIRFHNNQRLEFEYTLIEEDVDFISVGLWF